MMRWKETIQAVSSSLEVHPHKALISTTKYALPRELGQSMMQRTSPNPLRLTSLSSLPRHQMNTCQPDSLPPYAKYVNSSNQSKYLASHYFKVSGTTSPSPSSSPRTASFPSDPHQTNVPTAHKRIYSIWWSPTRSLQES